MSRTIYKYALSFDTSNMFELPIGYKILAVQMQHDRICVWAEVDNDPELVTTRVTFVIVGTGHTLPQLWGMEYVGTVQQDGFVWHVYHCRNGGPR